MAARFLATYPRANIRCDSADFPGVNVIDTMASRGAGLSGAADSKSGIFSGWVRLDGGDTARRCLLENATTLGGTINRFEVTRITANTILVQARNSAGTTILSMQTASTYLAGSSWRHVLASWDLLAGAAHLYINGTSDKAGGATVTNDTIDYTVADWSIGGRPDGDDVMNGCLAEIYFAPGQFLDFSVASNRRKFLSRAGKPVHLGTTGQLPTGTSPLVYCHLDKAETVNNIATNRGTGGNFSVVVGAGGALATGSTSPSD